MRSLVSKICLFTIICATIPADSKNMPILVYVIPIISTSYAQSPYISREGNYEGYYMQQNAKLNLPSHYHGPYLDSAEENKEHVQPLSIPGNDPINVRYEKLNDNESQKYKNKGSVSDSQNPLDVKSLYGQNNPIGNYYSNINRQSAFNMNLQQSAPGMQFGMNVPDQPNIKSSGFKQPVIINTRTMMTTQKYPIGGSLEEGKLKMDPVAISDFGINIMKLASAPAENFAISPYSIALILAMVQQGAHGKAQEQITNALGMAPNVSAAVFRNFVNLQTQPSRNVLKIATNLFVSNSFQLESEFKRNALQNFDSQASVVDFRNVVEASNSINNWVASKTQQRIKDLIKPGTLTPETKLVMANAIFYKGTWKTSFHPNATIPRTFTRARGDIVKIPFMRLRRSFLHGYDSLHKVQFVILPFEGEQQSLILLLPDLEQTIDKVLLRLKGSRLAQYYKSDLGEVEIEIPKFTVKEDLDLDPVLRSLGVTDIFTPYLSNLDGIGKAYGVAPEISKAVHSAMLSIDEEGATAAASTAFAAVALSYDEFETFRADRPFIAILWDNQLHVPLFLVRVENPTI